MKIKSIFIAIVLAGAALVSASCSKEVDLTAADTFSLRVSLTPEPGVIPVEGKTFTSSVVVAQGMNMQVEGWTVSVDNAPSWITVSKTRTTGSFVGTYAGDDATYDIDGIDVTVSANTTGAKRMANIRFTVPDGGSIIYTINQAAK